jgi:hypothetical protein
MLLEPTGVESELSEGKPCCRVWPNPGGKRVSFSVTGVSKGEPVSLRVFDLAGREVWSWQGTASGGKAVTPHWDGTTARGKPLASGVYFYRVELADVTYQGKVVHLR